MKTHKSLITNAVFCLLLTVAFPAFAAVNAPAFSLQGEGETIYRLSDYKGKPLILFFFSFSCPHCERVMPVIKDLYKKSDNNYNVLGIVYGTPKEDLRYKRIETGTEFPIAVGTKKTREDYKVSGTPYIWIIGADGSMKERFVGGRGAELLKGYLNPPQSPLKLRGEEREGKEGAQGEFGVGLFELSSDPKSYEGKIIETGGLLIQASPAYFPKPVFMITNGVDKVRVSSWLPLEVAPSPKGFKKQRRKVMSDFLDKYVSISGRVVLEDGRPLIEVRDAKILE